MLTVSLQDVACTTYDFAFVGAGASTSYSIVSLCEKFQENNLGSLKILVIESSGEFFKGVAYGRRSGRNALILTRLEQFFPQEELLKFAGWIREAQREKDIWSDSDMASISNIQSLDFFEYAATLGKLCVKRHLIGEFINYRVKAALNNSSSDSRITVNVVHAVATGVKELEATAQKSSAVIQIESVTQPTSTVKCLTEKVVLAVGSRPRSQLVVQGALSDSMAACVMNDPYSGRGLDSNHAKIINAIEARKKGEIKVVILGSNAAAMESIYLWSNWSKNTGKRIEILVVSTLGEFPSKISEIVDDTLVPVPEIQAYLDEGNVTSEGLYNAALEGLKRLKIQGVSLDCYNSSIDKAVLEALRVVNDDVRAEFLREKCNALGRYKRRAEKQYHDTMTEMLKDNCLKIFPGKFKFVRASNAELLVEVESIDGHRQLIRADGVVNCGSSESLDIQSSNPIIADLVESNLVEVDKGGNCFSTVDGAFRVSSCMYLIGPLLAGNTVKSEPVWHLEHCGRIIRFASALAVELLDDRAIRNQDLAGA